VGRGWRGAPGGRIAALPLPPSGGYGSQCLLFALLEMLHVEIACGFEPALVRLDGEGTDEAQATCGIGEDPHYQGAALELLVQPLISVSLC
jgi:hypothetical protein